MWLEYYFEKNSKENKYIFSIEGLSDLISIKNKALNKLCKMLKNNEFSIVDDEKKRMYSLRKFTTTVARGSGYSKNKINACTR